jgi:HD-like signal output (HDOD) protein
MNKVKNEEINRLIKYSKAKPQPPDLLQNLRKVAVLPNKPFFINRN